MLFGDNELLQLEASLHPNGHITLLQCCFRSSGKAIGNPGASSVLTAALPLFRQLLEAKGTRKVPFNLDYLTGDIINSLISLNWDVNPSSSVHCFNKDIAERLEVNVQGLPSFDGFHLFLIEEGGYERFLWKDVRANKGAEIKLPKDYLYKTLTAFLQAVEDSTYLAVKPGAALGQ